MTTRQINEAANALTALYVTARDRATFADADTMPHVAQGLRKIATTLDRARTRLIEDGPNYLDAAWAFVDAGRTLLANYEIQSAVIRKHRRAEAVNA